MRVFIVSQKRRDSTGERRCFDEFHTCPFYTPLAYYLVKLWLILSASPSLVLKRAAQKKTPILEFEFAVGAAYLCTPKTSLVFWCKRLCMRGCRPQLVFFARAFAFETARAVVQG